VGSDVVGEVVGGVASYTLWVEKFPLSTCSISRTSNDAALPSARGTSILSPILTFATFFISAGPFVVPFGG